jgi:hypothetical protein
VEPEISLEARRHAQLREFIASGAELEVGSTSNLPLPLPELLRTATGGAHVVQTLSGGLTAIVHQIRVNGQDYALKLRRPVSLVKNFDGDTAFLNELMRRAEIERLRALGTWPDAGTVTRTIYASHRYGILLTPWVYGDIVRHWSPRTLQQAFAAGAALIEAGLFEWDFSPGNVLDDGQNVWLFDLGYCYRFDPLTQFNTAGNGLNESLFHMIERFETRNLFAVWLAMEQEGGIDAALAHYRQAKLAAIECYESLLERLAAKGAQSYITLQLKTIIVSWQTALLSHAALQGLYLKEGWRSHMLDLDDDLRGKSCTHTTLLRADWLINALQTQFDALAQSDALLWGDRGCSREALVARYQTLRQEASHLLLAQTRAA